LPRSYLIRAMKRESFLPGFNSRTLNASHGGDLAPGKRKTARPIDPKQALHVVLRSSIARGDQSMLRSKYCQPIHDFAHELAERWGVRIYRFANVGNHIHLLLKVPSRAVWRRFIRELAGGIAVIVTGARKGAGLKKNERGRGFWDELVFTRIVKFGRDFFGVKNYLAKNLFEAAGLPVKKLLAQGYKIMTIRGDPQGA
jgi:REP element-mobilizing transposase RayT